MIPFLPIEQHGVIGDRRTAALVAADGTLNWLCLPRYDAPSVFGALLDTERGGFWRIGPAANVTGQQRYHDESATLVTTWHTTSGALELSDVMAWPAHERPSGQEHRRVVLRRLRCLEGEITATMRIRPRDDFDRAPQVLEVPGGISFDLERLRLGLWSSCPLALNAEGATAELAMRADDEVWAVLDLDMPPDAWSVAAAQHVFDAAHRYWHDWQHSLTDTGPRRKQVLRSALLVHLLSYAPTGALVAAPTTSLPEPPLPGLDADKVDASGEAYEKFSVPDATIGLLNYSATIVLASMGGADRHTHRPYLPLALMGKVLVDATQASRLTVDQWTRHRAFCSWCLLAAAATIGTVPLAVAEARAAFEQYRP